MATTFQTIFLSLFDFRFLQMQVHDNLFFFKPSILNTNMKADIAVENKGN